MDVVRLAEASGDPMTVKRVFGEFGEPYEREGVTVVPAATIRGGAGMGGGEGERDGKEQEGEGGGFAVSARPTGVYVISEGKVRWVPAVDVNRIVAGGQLMVLAAILLFRSIVKRRAR